MPNFTRKNLILVLLGNDDDAVSKLGGITRLQKLLYLLEQEEGISPAGGDFEFEPYKAGPYSARLYDDLEFLENFGLLASEVTNVATDSEAAEIEGIEDLKFGDLFGDPAPLPEDIYQERKFTLTEKGVEKVKKLIHDEGSKPIVEAVRRVKSKFSNYSLDDLLFYVYSKYPEMTTESEIKEKVLSRRRVS